jgi:hypothetical protein
MLAHAALLEGNIVAGCGSPRPVQFQHARSLGHAGCTNIITDCDTDVLVKGLPKTFAAKLESALAAASATANATTKVINDARGQGAAPPVKMIHWDDGGAKECRRRRGRAGGARVAAGSADYAALALDEEGQAAADAEAKESLASGSTKKQRREARNGVGLRGAVLGAIARLAGGKARKANLGLGQYGIGVSRCGYGYYVFHRPNGLRKNLNAKQLGYVPFRKSKLAMQFIARAVKVDLKANKKSAFGPHLSSATALVKYVSECEEEVDACLAGLIKGSRRVSGKQKTLKMLKECAVNGVKLMRAAVKERK